MKADYQLIRPDEMEARITLQAKVRDWKQLEAQLREIKGWPGWKLCSLISTVIGEAERHFEEEGEIE